MKTFTIIIDDETQKAMLWDIADLDAWANNAVFNKARQCQDDICRVALEDQTNTILTLADKLIVRDALNDQGIILTSVKQIPEGIKKDIVKKAHIKSAAERNLEGLEKEGEGTIIGMGMGAIKEPGFWKKIRQNIASTIARIQT